MSSLKRQPALKDFYLGYVTLTEGSWIDVASTARKELSLSTFYADGLLEDPERAFAMHFVDVDAYLSDHTQMSRTMLLDLYVTEEYFMGENEDFNPMEDFLDFDDPDDLIEEYGALSDTSEDPSHFDCSV